MSKGHPRGAAARVAALLKMRGWKLATAESCTGGMIASMLTGVPGVSEVYRGGFVTYVNEEKTRMLGVPASLLAVRGAVSKETARRMVLGAAGRCQADCALSVTGNAGPSASEGKAVGLVFIGCHVKGHTVVRECHFHGNRAMIRKKAASMALLLLEEQLGVWA